MVAGGKVVATVSGSDIDEFTASNPAVTVVLDTTDLERVIGMSYSKGKLSGLPSPDPVVPTVVPQSVTMRQARQYSAEIYTLLPCPWPYTAAHTALRHAGW